MPRSKKPKPSFDVARADLHESKVGRVYRSTEPDTVPAPAVAEQVAPPPPVFRAISPSRPEVSRGWIETGVGVLGLPLTLTVVTMMAPVLWFLTSRPGSGHVSRTTR